MKMFAILFLLVLITGCSTPQDLKGGYTPAEFKVKAGYQLVLKRFVDQHAECESGGLVLIGSVVNQVQNYPDLRFASITRGMTGIGTQIYQLIEIKEIAPNETEVKLYQRFTVAKFGLIYERWANGEKFCP